MEQFVVDAFTSKVFGGNPAAVCVLDAWPKDNLMQSIAVENNLSETAFTVREGDAWRLRWFTPGGEIELCGHATLATAFVLSRYVEPGLARVEFETLSGRLAVDGSGDELAMDFPSFDLLPVEVTGAMEQALGVRPVEAYLGADLVCVLASERQVRELCPDQGLIGQLDGLGVHVTARGESFDCVTRSFFPKLGVAEDPVCGRGHCHVVPYWASELGKRELLAYQASVRGGVLRCVYGGERTTLCGHAVLFSRARLFV